MKTVSTCALAFIGFMASAPAFADDLEFSLVSAISTGINGPSCSADSVHLINAGTDVSLIFDSMNVTLPAGGPDRSLIATGNCRVTVKMNIPKGTYLTQATSTITGGVEKNKGAISSLYSSMFLMRTANATTPLLTAVGPYGLTLFAKKDYGAREIVSEALVSLTDTRTYGARDQKTMCNWTKSNAVSIAMLLQIGVTGVRSNPNTQTAIISIDSSDTNFRVGMSTGKCSN
jgi:hypothetical protein